MKKEIIYIDDYALVVSDDVIKKGDLLNYSYQYIEPIGHVILKHNEPILENGFLGKKIIGHRPLKDAPILEGVPLLPEFSQEDEAEKLAEDKFPHLGPKDVQSDQNRHTDILRHGFKTGYYKAKETYKYTKEDMYKLISHLAVEVSTNPPNDLTDIIHAGAMILSSLQQPKLPVAIECEMKKDYLYNDDGDIYGFPVHPTNEVKTTTNSQGRTELVGEYIY